MENVDIVIIGAGPAGCTAGIYAARSGLTSVILGGDFPGGQILQTSEIENYPGFEQPLSGFELMDKVHKQCDRLGVKITRGEASKVTPQDDKTVKVLTADGTEYTAKAVIITVGTKARWLGIESEQKFVGRGVSSCATCDGFFFKGKDVCVIGGGNTALEDAVYLSKLCKKVYLIHRREGFRAEKANIEACKCAENLEFVIPYTVEEVLGDDDGVHRVKLKSVADGSVKEIPCSAVFVSIGSAPQTQFLQGSGVALDEHGYIKADITCKTNVDGIYAAGDCIDPVFKQVAVAVGSGAKAAISAINHINENR
ncbi:thioredoxin reductase (NADPH) [Parelusimicrobium proximum]|uniref:thioredoxin-disulfide reductase n=1 Tax=Parelusimicrobium proximum TaxID=3228953 RepID=UPI003D16B61A